MFVQQIKTTSVGVNFADLSISVDVYEKTIL